MLIFQGFSQFSIFYIFPSCSHRWFYPFLTRNQFTGNRTWVRIPPSSYTLSQQLFYDCWLFFFLILNDSIYKKAMHLHCLSSYILFNASRTLSTVHAINSSMVNLRYFRIIVSTSLPRGSSHFSLICAIPYATPNTFSTGPAVQSAS